MRNLGLVRSSQGCVQQPGAPQCVAVRCDSDSLLVASEFSITEFDPRTGKVLSEASLTAEGFLPEDGTGTVVGLQDLAELESACVATAAGDVILYNFSSAQFECVGSVDSGLTSMSWSPDEELVIFTTGQDTFIMMTKDFEPIIEVGIHQEEFGEGKFITVGWGKKETQFHGSEGKQAAQKKAVELQPAPEWDDHRPRVSWRGDGQLFAVSAVCPQSGARRIRLWSREGVLQATSEAISSLEQPLSWRPSGNLIASTQKQHNKHRVVFLEKNGLQHGDFTLPTSSTQTKVKELWWNNDSTVLALWLEEFNNAEGGKPNTHFQLWTTGNYHWYLKQSLDFGNDPYRAPVCACWDPVRPLQLHVVLRDWTTLTYEWGWTTEHSRGQDAADDASVAVIDGNKILVTNFRQCVVPPPMCSYELQLSSAVNQVMRWTETNTNNTGFRAVCQPLVLHKTYSIDLVLERPLELHHLLWLRADLFVAVRASQSANCSKVLFLSPSQDSDQRLIVRSEVEVFGTVVSVAHSAHTSSVALQLEDGNIKKLLWDGAKPSVETWEDSRGCPVRFPVTCVQTALCNIGQEECVLGLTDRCHLYAGDTKLASGVSSFSVCNDFLLVTTHSHNCRCLQLSSLTVKEWRGARIVTVVPQDTRVILQMPRGNLETVHHRALVLAQLRKWLDSLQFKEAFMCMRKLRINLNLIYDHNPKLFLDNAETFITQLSSINHINLFLTELKEEDTTQTMYPRSEDARLPPYKVPGTKVDVVCDALRNTMESMDPNKYCLSILTAHVRKTVPELEIALQKVHELRVNPPAAAVGAVSAEEALKYLLFLVNVNDLYEHSLGTYDFDLVLMVAEKSQKDPKEYLPFLNMLKQLEPNYQRYTIDKHLKRYNKALVHLSQCGKEHFPEVLQLVKEQKLYTEALHLFATDTTQYKELTIAFAEHLVGQQQMEQAGLLLWRCGETHSALQSFVSCCSWRHALCVAQLIPLPPDQLALLARDMAEKLSEQRRYAEAALLLDQYANDCEEAILALITGAVWDEALRLIHTHRRQDITETNLKPALLEAFSSQTAFLEAQMSTFTRHRNRLAVVREQKLKARADMLDEEGPDCVDAELYSEASSVLTGSKYSQSNSRISSRSSKNRRKAERKKLSLKEGSPMEDRALIHALGEIITTVDKMREEVHGLLKMLVLFESERQAQRLQEQYAAALSLLESAVTEVWPDNTALNNTTLTGPNSTANSISASFQQQIPAAAAPQAQAQDAEILVAPKMRNNIKWKLTV
ncbi:hypothetical protein WMY93_029929 [Mugilogobius chulae]|uniref:Elongator complex protein 1 n=1 Tax=Mugilogobius chulae TaxID=88201 RepID=A0AAW0MMC4_9GOBI